MIKSSIPFASIRSPMEVENVQVIPVCNFFKGYRLSFLLAGLGYYMALSAPSPVTMVDQYKVLAWNDLGMHCYNRSFQDLAVLPPYNTLWAQVIKVGDPPQIVTTGITVTYVFTDNTYSVGKSDFWTYEYRPFCRG